jgi:hypothetical protein
VPRGVGDAGDDTIEVTDYLLLRYPCARGDARDDGIEATEDLMLRNPKQVPAERVERTVARAVVTRAPLMCAPRTPRR